MPRVIFTSNTDLWSTPQDLFDSLDIEFEFTLDVCASAVNAKCPKFFTVDDDGLSKEWTGNCWMNPPYGREIGKWMRKAYESSLAGATVVCLIPSRTDTAWWHDFVMKASEIRYVRGRLKFGGVKGSAPFASSIVVFRPKVTGQASVARQAIS